MSWRSKLIKPVILVILTIMLGCKDKQVLESGTGKFQVTVKEKQYENIGIEAFLFLEDSLCGKTNVQGIFESNLLNSGKYVLTCSAINFRDTTLNIKIVAGETTKINLNLLPDNSTGIVDGEFQDFELFKQKAIAKPQINTWDESKIFEGVTGATMYRIEIPDPIPPRTVRLGDSILAVTDGFAQYRFIIQSGTYLIKGSCEGYYDSSRVIKVLPNTRNFVNFFLRKK